MPDPLQKVLAIEGDSQWLDKANVTPLQGRQEKGPGKSPAGKANLSP